MLSSACLPHRPGALWYYIRCMDVWLEQLIAHEVRYFTMVSTLEKTPCAWFLIGSEVTDYHDANRALHLRDDGRGPEAVAREVVSYFRARGLIPVADVDPEAEAQGIGAALRWLGITPVLEDRLLMRYPHNTPPLLPERGVEVRRIPNETGAGESVVWIETALADDADTEAADLWRTVLEHEARQASCRLYLGLLDGQPAGACDLFSAEGWGRIDSVATYPRFRRRGVASALVARSIADSLALGNAVTYLFTEGGGSAEQVYARLGFEPWGVNVLRRHIGRS
jgi:GNAT superfamily N-acetyltransferase